MDCTGSAVISKAFDNAINFPLAYIVSVGENGHCICYFIAGSDHIVEVGEKVDIVGILEFYTNPAQPLEQLAVEIQNIKYCHVGKNC